MLIFPSPTHEFLLLMDTSRDWYVEIRRKKRLMTNVISYNKGLAFFFTPTMVYFRTIVSLLFCDLNYYYWHQNVASVGEIEHDQRLQGTIKIWCRELVAWSHSYTYSPISRTPIKTSSLHRLNYSFFLFEHMASAPLFVRFGSKQLVSKLGSSGVSGRECLRIVTVERWYILHYPTRIQD